MLLGLMTAPLRAATAGTRLALSAGASVAGTAAGARVCCPRQGPRHDVTFDRRQGPFGPQIRCADGAIVGGAGQPVICPKAGSQWLSGLYEPAFDPPSYDGDTAFGQIFAGRRTQAAT